MLFEESKISFNDPNLFKQNVEEWSSGYQLKNELEVIGFYFSNHPVSLYPKVFFEQKDIIDFSHIFKNLEIKNAKIAGSILDVKERSNKEGKKYAFLTVSTLDSQFELSIFSDKLSQYRNLIKEGNVLIFSIDISRDNENLRLIIRKIEDLDKIFLSYKKTINIFLQSNFNMEIIKKIFVKSKGKNDKIYIYLNKDNKLISLDFSNNYEVESFFYLDQLSNAKKIDYSIEFS